LAECTVISRTPSEASSSTGASVDSAFSACAASSSTKPRKERPPVSSKVRARSQMRYTFASAWEPARRSVNPACARVASSSALMVSATGRGCDGDAGPPGSPALRRWARTRGHALCLAAAERVQPAHFETEAQQQIVRDGEQRSAQRAEHRKLVVRPLDGGQRHAHGFHLFPMVKRFRSDQQVRDPARFERPRIVARKVRAVIRHAAEQHANVLGLQRHARAVPQIAHLPAALVPSQSMYAAMRIRQAGVDLLLLMRIMPYGEGAGSTTMAGCAS
jgi:hypothetical protein